MPRRVYRPDDLEFMVFHGSQAIRDGLLTKKALRGPGWTRLRYGVYADSRVDHDHHLACRAAALMLPETAVISGPSAAYLLGVEHAAEFTDPVTVTIPPAAPRPRGGMVVHRTTLAPEHVDNLDWCRRTTAARTAWDIGARLDPVTAVPIIDSLLREGSVTPAGLDTILLSLDGRRGCARARTAFALADGRSQSPQESRLRVRLVQAGLPVPIPQFPVVLPGGRVVHPDEAWPDYKVAAEYDGVWHADEEQLHLDRKRLNLLLAAGWLVFHATSRRLNRDFYGFVREVRDGLISRGWRPTRTSRSRHDRRGRGRTP